MTSKYTILEATGYVPPSEIAVTSVKLMGADAHSTKTAPLKRNSDGSPARSYERWIRLKFAPTFGKVSQLRFWASNLGLNDEWQLVYGIEPTYRKPTRSASPAAIALVPTSDPGESLPNIMQDTDRVLGPTTQYSYYLVLQATYTGKDIGSELEAVPLDLEFAWREC